MQPATADLAAKLLVHGLPWRAVALGHDGQWLTIGWDGLDDLGIWLTCSAKAHDIAFVRHAEDSKLHHVSFQLSSWEQVLRAADIMSKNRVSIDVSPTRHGVTNGTTIYFFDPSGNRLETFCGGYDHYPDMEPITWTWDEVGAGIFYHNRKLNDAFLSVVT